MKPKYLIAILAGLLLTACTPIQPLPSESNAPTAPPVPESERTTIVAELTAMPLAWIRIVLATEQMDVEEPEKFSVNFMPDGTLSVRADCNQAVGSYTADYAGSLSIQMGPMTAAACPQGSVGEEFVRMLSGAANFFFEDGELYIDLFADGGTLVFEPVAAASASGDVAAEATGFSEVWETVECEALGIDPLIAEISDCGYVTVPENRAAGTPDTIQLGVLRIRSTSNAPGAPVIQGTGGPGGAGLDAAGVGQGPGFLALNEGIRADRDYVMFAQRGTALSIPELGCPAYDSLSVEAAVEGLPLEERGVRAREAIVACAEEFEAQGVDLAGYNSDENAADVNSIRQALGYDKIIYYGQSYGTLLGQFVLRNHPKILESIILDGIAPASATRVTDISNIPGAFRNVFAACAADEQCNASYPDLENVLIEAIDNLRENPTPFSLYTGSGSVPLVVDDLLAMNILFIQLYLPGGYAKMPAIVYALRDGDLSGLNGALSPYLSVSSSARIMHFATNCADDAVGSLDELGLDTMPAIYAGIVQEDGQKYVDICAALDLPRLPDVSDEVVQSDLPALLLQGGMDPATPVVGGDNVATGLPNSFMVVVPSGAHIQGGNPCISGIMDAFMTDPQTAPDTSCVDESLPFAFAGPVEYVDEASGNTIRAHLAPTWSQVGPGQFTNGDVLVVIGAVDATKSVGDLYADTAQVVSDISTEPVNGVEIAGMPTLYYTATLGGLPADIWLFGDAGGTYRVLVQYLKPAQIDTLREVTVPTVLNTISVGE